MDGGPVFSMPLTGPARKRLETLRARLLDLHKVLLEFERNEYERQNGAFSGATHFLNAVMTDPWFDWLHRISEMVVNIDELLEDEDATLQEASDSFEEARALFKTGEEQDQTEFMKRYKNALQREPASVLAHFELQKALLPEA